MRRRFLLPLSLALLGAALPGSVPAGSVPAGSGPGGSRGGSGPPRSPPKRIVSLNLCADQYALLLADRRQIAALTDLVHDPHMSAEAARAIGVPTSHGSAEDVLALRPDLILAAPGQHRATLARLYGGRLPVVELPPANSYREIVMQVRQVAAAVGHPERGEALVARMERSLAAVPTGVGGGATAGYYQRRGYLTGTGTLVDDLMHRVGLRNIAARLGKPVLARIGLEEMALARPDYLVVETATGRVTDQGAEMLHHPVLSAIPRLRLPEAWTVCGGPTYVRAARSLAAQLEATTRQTAPKRVRRKPF